MHSFVDLQLKQCSLTGRFYCQVQLNPSDWEKGGPVCEYIASGTGLPPSLQAPSLMSKLDLSAPFLFQEALLLK